MNSTIELHPEFLRKNGEPEFAVLPYAEYKALQEWLEDIEDILDLRAAREEDLGEPTLTIEEARTELGLN
jgi:hypothetical protein